MILNRLSSLLFLVVAILASNANAQLVVDVTGVPGSGVTTWTFSGESNVLPDCIRDVIFCEVRDVTNNTFSTFDSGQFPFGEDTILDTTLQDIVFPLTGNASITVGGTTQLIGGIYIDDDGGSADDFGIRTLDSPLPYQFPDTSSWTGSGTAFVDINSFSLGAWVLNDPLGQATFLSDTVNVNFTAVPEPATASLLLISLLGIASSRRRS